METQCITHLVRCWLARSLPLILLTFISTIAPDALAGGDEWTPLTPSPDSRVIYVSSSQGADLPSDLSYEANDPTIGPDPFHPVGNVRAYRTIAAAYPYLRDGMPDWILLRRGDSWEIGFDNPGAKWSKSGRPGEYMVIGAYGDEPSRPIIPRFYTFYGAGQPEYAFDHVAVTSMHFTVGLDRRIGGRDFLVEDCFFDEAGLTIQGIGPVQGRPYLFDVKLRRNVCWQNHNPENGRASNLYCAVVDGLLIEECVFDHGGWKTGVVEPNLVSHNVYLQDTVENAVFRGNISSRASSHGIQMRTGGICEDNLFLQNPINVLMGSKQLDWPEHAATGVVRDNVFIDSRDIGASARGFGVWIERAIRMTVERNILVHQRNGSFAQAIHVEDRYRLLTIRDNIVYDWTHHVENPQWGVCLELTDSPRGFNNIIEGNVFQEVTGGHMVIHNAPLERFIFRNNTYDTTNVATEWFFPSRTYEQWLVASGETGSMREHINFSDPGRDITSYLASIGYSGGLPMFAREIRKQSKTNWRPAFTAAAVNAYMRAGFAPRTQQRVDINRVDVLLGSHQSGSVEDVRASDDRYYVVRSGFVKGRIEPHRMIVEAEATGPITPPDTMAVVMEHRMSAADGRATLQLWNRITNTFDTIWSGRFGFGDTKIVAPVPTPASYYGADGTIILRIEHTSIMPFTPLGFESSIDLIEIDINE